jgi:hypothetical protein
MIANTLWTSKIEIVKSFSSFVDLKIFVRIRQTKKGNATNPVISLIFPVQKFPKACFRTKSFRIHKATIAIAIGLLENFWDLVIGYYSCHFEHIKYF